MIGVPFAFVPEPLVQQLDQGGPDLVQNQLQSLKHLLLFSSSICLVTNNQRIKCIFVPTRCSPVKPSSRGSGLPVPRDTQVPVLQDRVEVRHTDVEALQEGGALLQQPLAAVDHLTGAHTGLFGQAPQGQRLEARLDHSVLLHLQPEHRNGSETTLRRTRTRT